MTRLVVLPQHIPGIAGIITRHNSGRDKPLITHQAYFDFADWNIRNHLSYLHRRAINV